MPSRPRSRPRRSPGDPWTETSSSGLARAIRRRSRIWCTRSATRSSASPGGSCAIPVSPRTSCRTPSSPSGGSCRTCGSQTASRPGPTESSSTPATRTRRGTGEWAATVRVLPVDRADDADDYPIDRRSRRAGAGIPPAPARPAGRLRPAPPRGPAPRGGGRDARHSGRDGPFAIALRHSRAARRLRGGPGAERSRKDDPHERRPSSSNAPSTTGSRPAPTGRRSRRSMPSSSPSGRHHRNGISGSRGGSRTCPIRCASAPRSRSSRSLASWG